MTSSQLQDISDNLPTNIKILSPKNVEIRKHFLLLQE